jgi:hypothetical protein
VETTRSGKSSDVAAVSIASIKWLATFETEEFIFIIIVFYFLGFFSGASFSRYRRHNARKVPEP